MRIRALTDISLSGFIKKSTSSVSVLGFPRHEANENNKKYKYITTTEKSILVYGLWELVTSQIGCTATIVLRFVIEKVMNQSDQQTFKISQSDHDV